MFFLLKLILIVLINKTYTYITQDSEIILLPTWNSTGAVEIPLTLKVFGKFVQLNLRRNDQIVSSAFKVWKNNAKGITKKLSEFISLDSCVYLHENHVSSAVINVCQGYGLEGFIFFEDNIFEIQPLQNAFAPTYLSYIDDICVKEQINQSFGKPHLIKRLLQYYDDSNFSHLNNFKRKLRNIENTQEKFTIELAVFVDAQAYWKFKSVLHDDTKIRDMMLGNMNYVQTFFHSLSIPIDISLVRLNILKKQPSILPDFDTNETMELLALFCKYANTLNPLFDNDPDHWDISLYITGMKLFQYETNKLENVTAKFRVYDIRGQSYNNGACSAHFSCAIIQSYLNLTLNNIEFAGLRLSLKIVHVIINLLGLKHESDTDELLSAWHHGNVTWFVRNREKIIIQLNRKFCFRDNTWRENLDDDNDDDDCDDNWSTSDIFQDPQYYDLPGREWTAKAQCELFLRDKDANVVTFHDICQNLQCETPHKKKSSYFTKRALNGTHCALGKECHGGECVPVIEPPYYFTYCEADNWSEWREDSCKSNCLENSKGVKVKRRFCKHQTHETANCMGLYYDMVLCDDSLLCTKKRWTVDEVATSKCKLFSRLAKDTNLMIKGSKNGLGVQILDYDAKKPWVPCIIYCRLKELFDYYAPRQEMIQFGIDPYFPDGTWCHYTKGQNYYCRQHYCLPDKLLIPKI